MSNLKGINVSEEQGTIDWSAAKEKIDFAIIRCSYNLNGEFTADKEFEGNVKNCIENEIPFAVYHTLSSLDKCDEECLHLLELLDNYSPFTVFIDLNEIEFTDYSTEDVQHHLSSGISHLMATHSVGIYVDEKNFNDFIKNDFSCKLWIKKISSSKPNIECNFDMWNYSLKGNIPGIDSLTSVSYMYNDIRKGELHTPEISATIEEKETHVEKAIIEETKEVETKDIPYTVYYVKRGDTLSGIASRFGVNYRQLAAQNNISYPYKVYLGQLIKISK